MQSEAAAGDRRASQGTGAGSVVRAAAAGDVAATDSPVLLYDGVCALCNAAVRVVLAHDRRGTVRFAPLDGKYARAVLARHPHIQGADSLVLVEPRSGGEPTDEHVSVRSEAMIRLAGHMGGAWRAAAAVRIVPRVLRDAAYDLVARTRYRRFGRLDACPVPPAAVRHRFIA